MEEEYDSQEQEENRKDTRFKPGQSGNPGGRPKGTKSFQSILNNIGNESLIECPFIPEELKNKFIAINPDITLKEAVAYTSYINAITNDFKARDFVADRTEGKAPQTIKVQEEHVFIDIVDVDGTPVDVEKLDNTDSDSYGT